MAIADLKITHLGPQGDGICRGPKGTVFVDRGIPGDRVKAHIRRDNKGIQRAEIVRIISPSSFRATPPCPHYDSCGNCTLQHLKSTPYQEWKVNLVQEALEKYDLKARRFASPLFIETPSRRRATFTALWDRKKFTIGYYKRRTKEITHISTCLVADPDLLRVRDSLKPFLKEVTPTSGALDVFIQKIAGKYDVVLIGKMGKRIEEALKLVEPTLVSRLSYRHPEGEKTTTLFSRSPIVACFGDLKVELPPAAFLQPTPEGEKALVDAVMKEIPSEGNFADLFSGCGTFSGPMLSRGSVEAFESVSSATDALSRAAGKSPLKVFRRDLFKSPLKPNELNRFDAVVFDPPRAGAEAQSLEISRSRVPKVVAVSCNPATFAKDSAILCKGGYRLQSVQIVDQFQWSHHLEVVGVFTKPQSRPR